MSEDDDDVPRLSEDTLAALRQFYSERETSENFTIQSDRPFQENWQLSQFWYDDDTINALAKVVKELAGPSASVCLVSCPTLYPAVKRTLPSDRSVRLFEFDERFAAYGDDYAFYDFNDPLNLPPGSESKYDVVVADPPFLSEECLKKTSRTIRHLAKDKIILCTGRVMGELAADLLGLTACEFSPKHENNLANEFSCYANFRLDDILSKR